jgi:hypothetical protein
MLPIRRRSVVIYIYFQGAPSSPIEVLGKLGANPMRRLSRVKLFPPMECRGDTGE